MLHAPHIILCMGLKGSASTWMYNVTFEVLRAGVRQHSGRGKGLAQKSKVVQFYADEISQFPPSARLASHLVVKAHAPDTSLELLARFSSAQIILTVREPQDAVASIMTRFGHHFERVLAEVAKGSSGLVHLRTDFGAPVFRYEDQFHQRLDTVRRIADTLKVRLTKDMVDRIFDRHTPAAVTRRINRLRSRGAFGPSPFPDSFHPSSHWHPGHVGDGQIGKFITVLSPKQQRAVLAATRSYCRTFGYTPRSQ